MLHRLIKATLKSLALFILCVPAGWAELHPVSLRLQWKHQFEFAGFYAAKELGYYRDAGLDVEILEYENGVDIIDEVKSGSIDFAIWGSGIIERGMRNEPIVMLANYFKRSPLVLATQPDIVFPSELEGKTLELSAADMESANYTQMFQTFKVDKNAIRFVPPSYDVDNFKAGSVDGISIFLTNEPYLLKKQGIPYNIIDPNNFGVELYDVNLFSSAEFVRANPHLVADFIEASNRGWEYALDHPDELIDLIIQKYNTLHKTREHLVYEAQQTARMIQRKSYQIGSIDIEQVGRIANLFTEVGLADNITSPEDFVFHAFEPQVLLTQEEREFLANTPAVRVAMMPDFTPFSFIFGGEPQGFEHDLLKLISEKTGLRFEPEYHIWNKGLSAFKAYEVDVITSISYREERLPFTLFTEPYYEIPIMIYVRDDFGNFEGLDSLQGKKVGILKDVFYSQELEKLGMMDLVVYETYEQLTKALVYGRIDALMQNLTNIDALIKDNAYTNLRLAGELQMPTIKREGLRLGVRADQPVLLSIIQKGLDAISAEELMGIVERWLGTKANNEADKISFNEAERSFLEKHGAIRVCIDPKWMPLEAIDENGQHIGISAEIFQEIVANTGLKIELQPTESWVDSIEAIKQKRCDILSLVMNTPHRNEYLDFTLPYLTYPFVVATQNNQGFIDNLSLLNGKKVAMMKGYSTVELITRDYPQIDIVEVDSLVDGLRKVRRGEVDGYIDALPALASVIQQEGMTDIYIAGKLDQDFALSIATRKGDAMLLTIMQKALSSVQADVIQAINNKWLAVRYDSRVDYSLLYKAVAVFAVIAMLGFWRQRMIQRTQKIIEEKNRQLEILAKTDMLTGLYNRHKVDESLADQLDMHLRYGTSFAVIILDVDHFKRINDTHGHNVGDTTLVEFAKLIRSHTRRNDVVGRWGGEEFLIVVPQADKVDLVEMAEILRKGIEVHSFEVVGKVTASIGIAVHKNGESISNLLHRADEALYQSKHSGRNCTTQADR